MLVEPPNSPMLCKHEQAWVRVAHEALGRSWHTQPRLGSPQLISSCMAPLASARPCDVTLVSPARRNNHPHPRAAEHDGAVLEVARWRKQTATLSVRVRARTA